MKLLTSLLLVFTTQTFGITNPDFVDPWKTDKAPLAYSYSTQHIVGQDKEPKFVPLEANTNLHTVRSPTLAPPEISYNGFKPLASDSLRPDHVFIQPLADSYPKTPAISFQAPTVDRGIFARDSYEVLPLQNNYRSLGQGSKDGPQNGGSVTKPYSPPRDAFSGLTKEASHYSQPAPPSRSNEVYRTPSKPNESYGAPHRPSETYGTPSRPSTVYGNPTYEPIGKPNPTYGTPAKPNPGYGIPNKPTETYGTPKPTESYGVPHRPIETYGAPPKGSEGYRSHWTSNEHTSSQSGILEKPTNSYEQSSSSLENIGFPTESHGPSSDEGYGYGPWESHGTPPSKEIKFIIYKPAEEKIVKDTLIEHAHENGDEIKFVYGPNLSIKHKQKIYLPPPRKSIIYILLKEPEILTKVEVMGSKEEAPKPQVFIVYETGDGIIRKHYDLTDEESRRVVTALGDKMRLSKREENESKQIIDPNIVSTSTSQPVTSTSSQHTSYTKTVRSSGKSNNGHD